MPASIDNTGNPEDKEKDKRVSTPKAIKTRAKVRNMDYTIVLRSSGVIQKSGALIVRYSLKKECISFSFFFFLFYCFENLSIAITLEPLARVRWGFQ